MTAKRLETGGRIDRSKALELSFDGRKFTAHPGDTLASAFLASGGGVMARSFKFHRRRGVFSAGAEEPNALVRLRSGARAEPNARATLVEAYDGLEAFGQNATPNVRFDLMSSTGLFSRFLGAGFYYKTFIGPFRGTRFWMFCERFIRKAAGMGRASELPDPDSYEKINGFCDILIVGSGPSGLAAALRAGRAGADVVLAEQDFELGGALLSQPIGGETDSWLMAALRELRELPNVRLMARTTVFGAYDHDVYGLVERRADHTPSPEPGRTRQRFHVMRARQAVLATGAIEQPIAFGANDLPGVMLAGAMQSYVNRYAVLPGRRIVLTGANDTLYSAAVDLATAGAEVTLCDARVERSPHAAAADKAGVQLLLGRAVIRARGRSKVRAAEISEVDENGVVQGELAPLECDAIGVSGGFAPVLHLWSQRFGKPEYSEELAAFFPKSELSPTMHCAGRVDGAQTITERIASGAAAAERALAGIDAVAPGGALNTAAPALDPAWGRDIRPLDAVLAADGRAKGKAFVDLQHDVKLSDIDQAHLEGFVSVEHLKRYTTSGMATDQGKTSNYIALRRMARLREQSVRETGATTFRPPYTPVAIGAIAGRDVGAHFRPVRRTMLHQIHEARGAVMTDAGAWKRPWYYPKPGESIRDAYIREATHVRAHVGMVDVSTLGKIAVQGPDSAEFLNRVYVNGWKTLPIGRLRYGLMLRDDGLVMDDGATARLGEHDYFMSTTTANAAKVLSFAEHLLQAEWRDLKVHVTSVTDQWAAIAVAGPKSRELLQAIAPGADLSREALPNNHFTHLEIAGAPVRLHRMSFSGELAYELYIPALYAPAVWTALETVGEVYGLALYGVESMGALRIEKGHVAGPELDGRTTLDDIGLEGFASKKKPFVGSVLRQRPDLQKPDRQVLVGLLIEGDTGALPGALIFGAGAPTQGHGEGWVSSTTYSPALGRNIALAFIERGRERMGEKVQVVNFVGNAKWTAEIVSSHFYDPKGERQNA